MCFVCVCGFLLSQLVPPVLVYQMYVLYVGKSYKIAFNVNGKIEVSCKSTSDKCLTSIAND